MTPGMATTAMVLLAQSSGMMPAMDDAVEFGQYGLVGVMIFGILMAAIVAIVAIYAVLKLVPKMIDAWAAWGDGVVQTSANNVESAKLTATGMEKLGDGMEKMAESMRDMETRQVARHNEVLQRLAAKTPPHHPHPHPHPQGSNL